MAAATCRARNKTKQKEVIVSQKEGFILEELRADDGITDSKVVGLSCTSFA